MAQTADLETVRDLAHHIAAILTETPAAETVILDIHEISSIADYFVICSGENERQLRAIAETIDEELGQRGSTPLRMEGDASSGWILMDYGDVVVHVFDNAQRSFYKIEDAWAEAPRLLSIQ